jgi:hypothetical protein
VILEQTRLVAEEYKLPTAILKPCIATLLDGNLHTASRHDAAFTIGIDLRDRGLTLGEIEPLLRRWAKSCSFANRG